MTSDQNRDPPETHPERPTHTWEDEQDFKDRVKTLGNLSEAAFDEAVKLQEDLNAKGEGRWKGDSPPEPVSKLWRFALIIVILLIIAVGAFYFTTGNDLLTGLREDPLGAVSVADANLELSEAFTHEELVLQEPIGITDGPWRFFLDKSEQNPLYDIKFEADGTCFVPGDKIIYGGKYFVNGANIEIELFRRYTAEAKDGEGNTRSEEVEWTDWFHMTRSGNTMTGSREVEVWRFSFDNGLVWKDNVISSEAIFSRPERPEDPG